MALLIVGDKKIEAEPKAKGVLSVMLNGSEIGEVKRLDRSCYRSSTGRQFPAQVSAIRDVVSMYEARQLIF